MFQTKTLSIVTIFVPGGWVIARAYAGNIPLNQVRAEAIAFAKDEYLSAHDKALATDPRLVITEGIPLIEA